MTHGRISCKFDLFFRFKYQQTKTRTLNTMGSGKSLFKRQCRELLELDEQVAEKEKQLLESMSIWRQWPKLPSGAPCCHTLPTERMNLLLSRSKDKPIDLSKSQNTCSHYLTILLYSIIIIFILITIYYFSNTCSSQRFAYLALDEA